MPHRTLFRRLPLLAALLAFAPWPAGSADQEPPHSRLVYPGPDGRLVYQPYTDRGDTLPDFSTVGYRGGGVPLPDVPARATLSPREEGDDLPRIQAAVDEVARLPRDEDGYRGAVLLRRGVYRLNGTLRIAASGVVLRGEGSGEDGTVLVATLREQHALIQVGGSGSPRAVSGSRQPVTDEYVPVGARSFAVRDASGFRPGDLVIVHRPSTAEWISALGMDRIREQRPGLVQWAPGNYDLRFQRVVTAVEGNRVTVDAPLVNSLDARYGGGVLYKYEFPGRIERVGVESLRGVSEFDRSRRDANRPGQFTDEEHAWDFISIDRARDGWVREVVGQHFGYSAVYLRGQASRFTVRDSQCLDPVSRITGGTRYSFAIAGQLNLVERATARHGRHDFVMHSRVPGPNVFVDCRADNAYSDSGPHHRWATGTLFDNVVVNGHDLNVQDRQWSGTGHGWAGAQMVFWNCTARSIVCQQPPTAQNFAIGCQGRKGRGNWVPDAPDGWWEHHGRPVEPRSLYRAQLEERLGGRGDP